VRYGSWYDAAVGGRAWHLHRGSADGRVHFILLEDPLRIGRPPQVEARLAPLLLCLIVAACGDDSRAPAANSGSLDAAADVADEGDAQDTAADAPLDADAPFDASAADATACVPGSTEPCYTGAPATKSVGACKAGLRICAPDGSGYGDCLGEVTPSSETCATPVDDDCDGQVNEEGPDCACMPGEASPCYSGPAAAIDVGACKAGTQVCNPSGTGYGPCYGEVLPSPETCATTVDDDCDGELNEEGAGCVCVPGAVESCYSGPAGTAGVGACTAGTRACDALGTSWGPCAGEVLPQPESCATALDDDCDGQVNEEGPDCICSPGATSPCYSGPYSTVGTGICTAGVQTCLATGSGYGLCEGQITPKTESCQTNVDDDCDGVPECPGDVAVAKTFGGAGDETAGSPAVATSSHIALLVQRTTGNPSLLSIDSVGNVIAERALAITKQPIVLGRVGSDVLLAGRYTGAPNLGGAALDLGASDLCLARYTGAGAHVWSRGYLAPLGTIEDDLHADGSFVSGKFKGYFDIGLGPVQSQGTWDRFIAKIDPATGDPVWARRLAADSATASGPTQVFGMVALGDSAILLALGPGGFDFGNGPAGTCCGSHVYLVRFGGNGAPLWTRAFPGYLSTGSIALDRVTTAVSARIVVSGTSAQGVTLHTALPAGMFVAGFKDDGSPIWDRAVPDCTSRAVTVFSPQAGALPNVAVSGECAAPYASPQGPVTGSVRLGYLMSLNEIWSRGAATSIAGRSWVARGADLWWIGDFSGTLAFGTTPNLPSAGGKDVFWARVMH
jgi:hypothetical protein